MTHQLSYEHKRTSADQAIRQLRDGDTIIVPTGVGEPTSLLTALSEQRQSFRDVKVCQILAMRKYGYIDPATTEHVRHVAFFFGGATRAGGQEGWIDFIPNYFSEIPAQIERGQMAADVVFAMASPMDEHGFFALSLGADYTMAAVKKARAVVLEVNPNVPFAFGNCHVHISQVAALVESDAPVLEVGLPKIGPVQQAIGKYVADLIDDGSTLQIGYGGIPDAVVMQLTGKKDLGIHTEMIGDGIMTLVEAGAVTNRRKNFMPGKMVATFGLGSAKLYRFMHRNPGLEMHPVEFTNDPAIAGLNDNLVAINATLQIDFLGQCGSESLAHAPYSGTGGQADFVRAANRSKGGKAFIVLPSTAKDDTISRIVPSLSPCTHVTTSKNDINYVVTEYGVAQLRGKSMKQRTQELIAIADPKFRDELTAQARALKILRSCKRVKWLRDPHSFLRSTVDRNCMQVSASSSAGTTSSSAGASDIAKLQKQLRSLYEELKGVATSNMDAKAKKEKVKLLQAQIQMVQAQISAIQRARQQEQQDVQSRKAEASSAQRKTPPHRTNTLGSQLDTFA